MRRSPYTSKFSAVVLSCLLAVAFGSVSQTAGNLHDPVHGIPPAGAEKEQDETGRDLRSPVGSSGAASPKAARVDASDAGLLHSNALNFGRHADVNFPHQIPLPRHFSGYFDKQKYAALKEAEPKRVDPAGSQVKPLESLRRKRSTELSMKDNKGDHGDHLLPDEPGAKVHCWNEAHVFDVVLPASEVTKHFPRECQHPLSCNTTCVAKVPGRDVPARQKSRCTEPTLHSVTEAQLGTAQNENKQLASFEKNVERRLAELDAKLAQLSLESSNHQDKLVKLDHNVKYLSNARKEQLSAASVKIVDSLNRKAAEMKSLFNEKSQSMMTAISSVLSLIQSDSKTHMWTLKGYAATKAEAIKYDWSKRVSEKVYVARYLISWGIHFEIHGGGVNLHLSFELHKGRYDEFLKWPFLNEMKLTIIHPESGDKQEGRGKPGTTKSLIPIVYGRPVHASNGGVYFKYAKFESSYLERNGYVKDDQLLLMLEVLS